MPAKLDWRIEDEDFSPTDDLPSPQRRSGWARWGGLALFLGLVLALGLGALWQHVRREQRKVEQELREVVELELAALRRGDRELFLSFQDPGDADWRAIQEAMLFDKYQTWAELQAWPGYWVAPWEDAAPAYTGDVGRVRISGKEGWAQVGIECPRAEGLCWQTWPYGWLAGVWRHVPIDETWMGEHQELNTAHLRLIYRERDEAAARELAADMEAWYARLAPLYGLNPSAPTAPQVRLELGLHPYSETNPAFGFAHQFYRIYGPALEQVLRTQDGALNHETRRQLAILLAQALVADAAGLTQRGYRNLPVEMWALEQELQDWALAVLDIPPAPGAPGTPLLDALVAQHGQQAVGRLVAGLGQWQTLDQALEASQLPLADSTRIFAFLIESRRRLEWGDNTPHRQALDDPQAEPWVSLFTSQEVTIQSVSFREDLAWVEVESLEPAARWPGLSDEREQAPDPDDLVRARRTLFFRRADERWLYTRPDPAYFGARQEERSANLVLGYPARDARWYQGLTDSLQPVLEQAAADLGIEPGGLVLTVEVGILPADFDPDTYYQNQIVYNLSPHLSGWNETHPTQRWLAFECSEDLIYLLIALQTGMRPASSQYLLYNAVWEWELTQLFPEEMARSRQLQMPLRDPERFDELEFQSDYYSLVAYLVEAYGPETLPRMLDSLNTSDDLDSWLRQVTGGDGVAEVEPAWQVWVARQEGDE